MHDKALLHAPIAAATALLRREPLSFVAYELAVRLEHVEVSLKLAGEPMNSTIANGAFRAANCAFRAIFARTRCPRWSPRAAAWRLREHALTWWSNNVRLRPGNGSSSYLQAALRRPITPVRMVMECI